MPNSPGNRAAAYGDHARPAFSLIEVIVTIAVIGLLIGLILPAVQSAREAARRSACIANLRQIGIGILNYSSVHKVYPADEPYRLPGYYPHYISGFVVLLPHLEQTAVFNAINMDVAAQGETATVPAAANHTVRNTRLALFLCPSDMEPRHLNSYRFNEGRYAELTSRYGSDGSMKIGAFASQSTVTNGFAQTAFVSERVGGSFSRNTNDPRRDLKSVGHAMSGIFTDAQYIPICLTDDPGFWNHDAGRYWFFSGYGNGTYNHNGLPNDARPSCVWGDPFLASRGGLSPPRSEHPGGVNVLFGDGHTEFVTEAVAPQTWMALGTYHPEDIR
jgi:prepilin-type processing-associated H-X9-DG protein/prepilin-type N-terminal cleavage/methylation domain-containing protein